MLQNEIEQNKFSLQNKDAIIEQLKPQIEELLNEINQKENNLNLFE